MRLRAGIRDPQERLAETVRIVQIDHCGSNRIPFVAFLFRYTPKLDWSGQVGAVNRNRLRFVLTFFSSFRVLNDAEFFHIGRPMRQAPGIERNNLFDTLEDDEVPFIVFALSQ